MDKNWVGISAIGCTAAALISWPFVVMFYVDVTNAGVRARMRRVKRKKVQRQK